MIKKLIIRIKSEAEALQDFKTGFLQALQSTEAQDTEIKTDFERSTLSSKTWKLENTTASA